MRHVKIMIFFFLLVYTVYRAWYLDIFKVFYVDVLTRMFKRRMRTFVMLMFKLLICLF